MGQNRANKNRRNQPDGDIAALIDLNKHIVGTLPFHTQKTV